MELDLTGASRTVTFAERQRRPMAEPVTARRGEEGTMNTMLNQVADGVLGPAERVGLEQCHRGARGGWAERQHSSVRKY